MGEDANRDADDRKQDDETTDENQARNTYGAESAPDDTAPDIVVRGSEKDAHDAEVNRRREG